MLLQAVSLAGGLHIFLTTKDISIHREVKITRAELAQKVIEKARTVKASAPAAVKPAPLPPPPALVGGEDKRFCSSCQTRKPIQKGSYKTSRDGRHRRGVEQRPGCPAPVPRAALGLDRAVGGASRHGPVGRGHVGRDGVQLLEVGGNGVSGASFMDNAALRQYTFETFSANAVRHRFRLYDFAALDDEDGQ